MPSHMVTFLHGFLKYNVFANAYKLAAVLYNNLYTSESHSLHASVSHAELHHIAGMIIFRYKVITKLHTTVLFEADALVKSRLFSCTNAPRPGRYRPISC